MIPEGFADQSKMLKPGVYILRRAGRTVFVGRAKKLIAKINAHGSQTRGRPTPDWLPTKPIQFDEVLIQTCLIEQVEGLYNQTLAETGWREPTRPVFLERARA